MGKIKIFARGFSNTPDELEKEMNDWFNQHPNAVVEERHVAQSISTNSQGVVFVTLSIVFFFRE
jgi:hypothetical protein